MKTWKVRYYVRNLITFAVVHADTANERNINNVLHS